MSERTKQVQFRMLADAHKELKKVLIDDEGSLADFLNEAAVKYLKKKAKKWRTTEEK